MRSRLGSRHGAQGGLHGDHHRDFRSETRGTPGSDAFFVGSLGPAALAGVTLVFPLKMLMQHMAASGMGGGLAAALRPSLWMGIFTSDAEVLEAGFAYLRIVGPVYGVYGLGLYFASQGFGRLGWPVVANVVRLGVAGGGGWLMTACWGGGLGALCGAMAAAVLAYCGVILIAINRGTWRRVS